ncbi:hypothetical protein PCANC_06596 [Puccinia coronata f. sp. avenae]|uniref:Uncharacterized protein n=1 Tax=Puccinia coronata f. sp. avenae TaxID=200324 RepID=A0A2N5VA42_9BASI|nr:hypothetical protein PCANC_06596 [Puccinia coronata f. sp. avenae]
MYPVGGIPSAGDPPHHHQVRVRGSNPQANPRLRRQRGATSESDGTAPYLRPHPPAQMRAPSRLKRGSTHVAHST